MIIIINWLSKQDSFTPQAFVCFNNIYHQQGASLDREIKPAQIGKQRPINLLFLLSFRGFIQVLSRSKSLQSKDKETLFRVYELQDGKQAQNNSKINTTYYNKMMFGKMQNPEKAQGSEDQSYQIWLSWSSKPTEKSDSWLSQPKRLRPKPKRGKSKRSAFNSSLWTISENTSYMIFLIKNQQLFDLSKIQRRDIKINVLMSQQVKTRSPDQCRSHHQKMMKYHSSIQGIIQYVRNLQQIGVTLYNQQQKQFQFRSKIEQQSFIEVEDLLISREESFCFKLMTDDDFI